MGTKLLKKISFFVIVFLPLAMMAMVERGFSQENEALDIYGPSDTPLPENANQDIKQTSQIQVPLAGSQEQVPAEESLTQTPQLEIPLNQASQTSGSQESTQGCGNLCNNKTGDELEKCLCEEVINNPGIAELQGNQCMLKSPQLLIKKIKNPIKENQPLRLQNERGFNGSAYFTGCQQKTWKNWKDWVAEIKRSRKKIDGTEHFAPYWHYKINEFIKDENKLDRDNQDNVPLYDKDVELGKLLRENECLKSKLSEMDPNRYGVYHISRTQERIEKFKEILFELAAESNTWFAEVQICSALLPLTALHVDYNNSDFVRPSAGQASFDKKISCKSVGVETQDYPACLNIMNIYNGAMMSQPILQTAQGIDYQDKMSEIQNKQMKDQLKNSTKVLETKADTKEGGDDKTLTSEYERNQITSGLEAKKASLEKQKEIAHVRAAFHGAKGATILGLAQSMPNAKKLVEDCMKLVSNTVGVKEYHAVLKLALNPFDGRPSLDELFGDDSQWLQMKEEMKNNDPTDASYPVEDICWGGFRKANLVLNQDAKQAAIAIAVQAGAEMGTNLITGGMLDKQAKQLGEIIDEVGKYKPEEEFVSKVGDLDCEKTPGHPFCVQERLNRTQKSPTLKGEYNFGDSNLATTAGEALEEQNSAARDKDPSKTTGAGKIGSIVEGSSSGGGRGFESYVPKARVKRGRLGSGGGSGGSSARVGSARGGGRKARRGGRGPRRRGGIGKAANLAYQGGKGSYTGGRGRSGKSKSTSKNPFANLFKKGKKGKGKNVLNFRDIAAKDDQRGSIWKMISNRYQETDKKNLLLKYKTIK